MSTMNSSTSDEKPWHFKKGNTLAAANKGNNHRAELKKALIDADTPENIRSIGRVLIAKALAGDVPAARLYFEHTIGKPNVSVEISGKDGASLNLFNVVNVIAKQFSDDPDAPAKIAKGLGQLQLDPPDIDVTSGDTDGR